MPVRHQKPGASPSGESGSPRWACSAGLSSLKQSLPLKVILSWAEELSGHIQQNQLLPYGCVQQLTHMPQAKSFWQLQPWRGEGER